MLFKYMLKILLLLSQHREVQQNLSLFIPAHLDHNSMKLPIPHRYRRPINQIKRKDSYANNFIYNSQTLLGCSQRRLIILFQDYLGCIQDRRIFQILFENERGREGDRQGEREGGRDIEREGWRKGGRAREGGKVRGREREGEGGRERVRDEGRDR